jgi:hypothetical protein
MTKGGLQNDCIGTCYHAGAAQVYNMTSGALRVVQDANKPDDVTWVTLHPAGTPDLLALFPDSLGAVYIEVKDGRDRLQPSQVQKMQELAAAGFTVYVCSAKRDRSDQADLLRSCGVIFVVGWHALLDSLMEKRGMRMLLGALS